MQRISITRNKIIIFELILLVVMLTLSTKIYLLQNKLIDLSNIKSAMIVSMYQLENLIKDSGTLNREYILSGDKGFKTQYIKLLDNGETFEKISKVIKSLPFSKKELNVTTDILDDFHQFLKFQDKAINLYKNNKQNAIEYVLSKHYKHLEVDTTDDIKQAIDSIKQRIQISFEKQTKIVSFYFILLAIIGTVFVIINIYFFVYLANIAMRQLTQKNKLINKVEHFNDTLEDEVQKRTKEIQKLMKIKSEFLANMSHEIRTPLNAMFGFIRLLRDKDFDKESKKYLSIIEKSGKNLLTIINDILDFSKIEAGKLNIEKVEFNPKEEIEIIYNLFANVANEKDIKLIINENLKYNIITDPVRLKQVISNLLSNAIKFSHKNSDVILNIIYDEKSEKLYVEVIDEGIGIPKEKLEHIFEAFSQADSSTTRKYGGTGLGLSISNKLIELLGGELSVESEETKGTTFYFSIPAKKTIEIKKIQNKKELKVDAEKFNMDLLLVEDNKANQMFMQIVLQKMGLSFDIANDGVEALEKFKDNKYDVILMDENMPNMNGIEATKKIRILEREGRLFHTPIIALTANVMEGDKERFIKAGMDFYLPKPLEIDKFKEILKTIRD